MSYGEVLVDKSAMYIRAFDYIVTISFGYILHCVCFKLHRGGFILFCNVWVLL